MKSDNLLPQLSTVRVVQDGNSYYLESVKTGDRFDQPFKSSKLALYHVMTAFLVMDIENSKKRL